MGTLKQLTGFLFVLLHTFAMQIQHAKWTDAYKEAREYLYGTSEMEPDEEAAYEIMKEEAEQGNAYAMADMGKM